MTDCFSPIGFESEPECVAERHRGIESMGLATSFRTKLGVLAIASFITTAAHLNSSAEVVQYFIFARSSISPGPVGCDPSVWRVHSLEPGISCAAG